MIRCGLSALSWRRSSALPGARGGYSVIDVTVSPCLSLNRLCVMLCLFLVLLSAAVQGVSAADRIQHDIRGEVHGAHHHEGLGAVTLDGADIHVDTAGDEPRAENERDAEGTVPANHHHHADHGSSLPELHGAPTADRTASSLRLGIPLVAAVPGQPVHAPERPPKTLPSAA
ncbi:hypothetical protein [Novosphingobium barchaimii]|uniref:hypothetical protein n=1 Tax=Novosphingobium barchaimii TaxID=1420591 RepID=UPI001F3B72EE|nr:hypothetical protein [Novosphingobium barchaimii]